MSIQNDNMNEVIRKSSLEMIAGDNTEYFLRVGGGLIQGVDWDYLDVQQTSGSVETFVFKDGGASGTIVRTVVLTYTDSNKTDLDTVARTV